MGFTSIPQALINVGKALVQPLFQYFKDNDDYLYGKIESMSADGVMNGSFELDTDLDGVPNNWTVDTYPGGQYGRMPSIILGTNGLAYTCIADHTAADTNKPITGAQWATYWQQSGSTTEAVTWASGKAYRAQNAAHGRFGLYFVHPGGVGNGGGYADSDYIPCSPIISSVFGFIHWASNPLMKNQVYVRYYDKDKIYISEAQLYSSTNNPTTKNSFFRVMSPPTTAQFYKIRLIGGYTDTNQSGIVFFDGIKIFDELPDSQLLRNFIPTFLDTSVLLSGWTTAYTSYSAVTYNGNSVNLIGQNGGGVSGSWFSRTKLTDVIPNLIVSPSQVRFEMIITNMTSFNQFAGARFYVTQENPTSARATDTPNHFGFRIDSSANILASNANGTTETTTDSGIDFATGAQFTTLTAVLNPGVDARYFVNGICVATHTTNLPASGNYRLILELDTWDDPSGTMTLLLPDLVRQK